MIPVSGARVTASEHDAREFTGGGDSSERFGIFTWIRCELEIESVKPGRRYTGAQIGC